MRVPFEHTIRTGGQGIWSNVEALIKTREISLDIESKTLNVYFDQDTWNIEKDGLIYTDPVFINQLRSILNSLGLNGAEVTYSEQGLQGRDFVNFDLTLDFVKSFLDVYPHAIHPLALRYLEARKALHDPRFGTYTIDDPHCPADLVLLAKIESRAEDDWVAAGCPTLTEMK